MLIAFVKEHIEIIKPPRALWLNFPMGRPLGKPNNPEFQKKVIRTAFDLFEKKFFSDLIWVSPIPSIFKKLLNLSLIHISEPTRPY